MHHKPVTSVKGNNGRIYRNDSQTVLLLTMDDHRDLYRTKEERIFGEGILLRY